MAVLAAIVIAALTAFAAASSSHHQQGLGQQNSLCPHAAVWGNYFGNNAGANHNTGGSTTGNHISGYNSCTKDDNARCSAALKDVLNPPHESVDLHTYLIEHCPSIQDKIDSLALASVCCSIDCLCREILHGGVDVCGGHSTSTSGHTNTGHGSNTHGSGHHGRGGQSRGGRGSFGGQHGSSSGTHHSNNGLFGSLWSLGNFGGGHSCDHYSTNRGSHHTNSNRHGSSGFGNLFGFNALDNIFGGRRNHHSTSNQHHRMSSPLSFFAELGDMFRNILFKRKK